MEIRELEILVNHLSWDMPEAVQQSAMKSLMDISEEYVPLLIQDNGKSCWDNAVKVMRDIGYPRNRLAIPKLIWLFQDMNWPGVSVAIEIIRKIDKNITIPYIEDALKKAADDDDYMWIGGIQRLVDILDICETDFTNKNVSEYLKLSDW